MTTANTTPIRINGPASMIEAVPYLLGFNPTDSLVLVGLREGRLTITARLDLADLDNPRQLDEVMNVLARTAESSDIVAITYGQRTDTELVADTTTTHGMRLVDHLRVAEGRYWSLLCPIKDCCPPEGRPVPTDQAIAAEFVGAGAGKAATRQDLDAIFNPIPGTDRLLALIHAAEQDAMDALLTAKHSTRRAGDKRALFAAARRDNRDWTDQETARFGAALTGYDVRDALWLAIDQGRLDGRDLFLHLARTLPGSYRAAPLFLFGWKTWREGNGALAAMAAERALKADPTYSAADLLQAALARGIDPRRMPALRMNRT